MVEAGLSRPGSPAHPGPAARLARHAIALAVWIPANALGLAALTSPVWAVSQRSGAAVAPLALAALVTLSAAALALEASSGELGARRVAAVGALAAIAGALRFLETIVPGPAGFSPVFFPVIVGGYVFGARFGFLTGVTTMLVSAVVTGGVGPWLPAQTLITGWVGMTAAWVPGGGPRSGPAGRGHLALIAFGAAWGMLYGLLLTPWSWLLFDGRPDVGGNATGAALRMASFYVSTSALWDAFRAAGNALLLAVAAPAVIRALRRLGRRFAFDARPQAWRGRAATAARHDHGPVSDRAAVVPGGDKVGRGPTAACRGRKASRRGRIAARRGPTSTPNRSGRRADGRNLPAIVWVSWLTAVAVLASSSRNPIVLATLLAAVAVVRESLDADGPVAISVPIGRIALYLLPLSTLYGLLVLHAGDHVLTRLPGDWPMVGGALTLEGLAYGLSTGMVLLALLAAFSTTHLALGSRGLIRLLPRAFASLDLAAVVALAHLPAAGRLATQAREAWRVRGGAVAGPSSLRHLAVPVFSGGLERSLQLAESLAVRGLVAAAGPSPLERLSLAASLLLITSGWLGAASGRVTPPWSAAIACAGFLVGLLLLATAARRAPRTDYRPTRWSGPALAAVALPALALVAAALPAGRAALAWSPFPSLATPVVDPLLTLAIGLTAAPAAAVRQAGRRRAAAPAPRVSRAARDARAHPVGRPIRATGLGYRYPDAHQPVFLDLSFELAPAALHVVAGPSGSGKSTLLRTMAGLVPHFTGGALAGRLDVAGLDPIALGPAGVAGRIGIVSGDPDSAFVMDAVEDEVAYALEARALPPDVMARRVRSALRDVGLWRARDRSIRTLSGGERQRVAIAAALALEPDVLLLDEPTSQLDDRTATEVLDVVQSLSRRRGTTVVLSEHRLDRVLHRAVSVLWLGPAHAAPGGKSEGQGPASVRDDGHRPTSAGSDGQGPLRIGGRAATCRPGPAAPKQPRTSASPPIRPRRARRLEARALWFAYPDRTVLRNVTLLIRSGEIVALTGASGSGKSTLLRLAVGLLEPASGQVCIDGQPVTRADGDAVFRRIAYLPQDPDVLLLADTVAQELDLTMQARGLPPLDGARDRHLERLGLAGMELAHPRDISTGERLRVALAAVTVAGARLLVLDEPTRGLDAGSARALGELLRDYAADGAGVLVATHDRRIVAGADRVLDLERGRLCEHPPERDARPRRSRRPRTDPGTVPGRPGN